MAFSENRSGPAQPKPLNLKPLTPKERAAIRKKVEVWLRNEVWTLGDACLLVRNVHPDPVLGAASFVGKVDAEILVDYAVNAVDGGSLKLISRDGKPGSWKLYPKDFAEWVKANPWLVGEDRASLFAELFPSKTQPASKAARQRVLESEFGTPEFDVALAAIDALWLPAIRGERAPPTQDEVSAWLEPQLEQAGIKDRGRAIKRIDALIRPSKHKDGGRRKKITVSPKKST